MLDLSDAPIVELPVRGEWAALHTPAERVPSHGTDAFGQRYAFDFYRLDSRRDLPYRASVGRHLFASIAAEDCLCWNEPVFAAFAGTVIRVGEGWPDRLRINLFRELVLATIFPPSVRGEDLRPLAGNFVLVEGEPGVALYAHLREGSVCVEQGQRIGTGELLGRVGNSGNSTMPHLHFHVMDSGDPRTARGRLCAFRRYERRSETGWEPVGNGVPRLLERIRAIAQ